MIDEEWRYRAAEAWVDELALMGFLHPQITLRQRYVLSRLIGDRLAKEYEEGKRQDDNMKRMMRGASD